ncbi:hypothetical protein EV126DRAFT_169727 [Verticillium dahliae]|nr:hypothetical protein EV126DRAFT_169727 [Verticillium dahliae]
MNNLHAINVLPRVRVTNFQRCHAIWLGLLVSSVITWSKTLAMFSEVVVMSSLVYPVQPLKYTQGLDTCNPKNSANPAVPPIIYTWGWKAMGKSHPHILQATQPSPAVIPSLPSMGNPPVPLLCTPTTPSFTSQTPLRRPHCPSARRPLAF